jgi:hypothetical protein
MLRAMEESLRLTQEPDIERLLMICKRWGYRDVPELIDKYLFKETCPAVCLKCGNVAEKSADALTGWCSVCDRYTMRSALVLAGIL